MDIRPLMKKDRSLHSDFNAQTGIEMPHLLTKKAAKSAPTRRVSSRLPLSPTRLGAQRGFRCRQQVFKCIGEQATKHSGGVQRQCACEGTQPGGDQ